MKKIFLFVIVIILFCSFVLAGDLSIYSAKCFKDGSAEITLQSNNYDDKIYVKNITLSADYLGFGSVKSESFELTGEWEDEQKYLRAGVYKQKEYATFKTDEALFRDVGEYIINVKYKIEDGSLEHDSFQFICAGMIFSCTLINVEVESCKTTDNRKFEAVLDIKGISQSDYGKLDLYGDIEYVMKAKNNYEDIVGKNSKIGSLPKGFSMIEKNGKYHLSYEFEDNFIYSILAKFHGLDGCRNTKKYPNITMYSYKECDFFESKEEVVKDIKVENKTEKDVNRTEEKVDFIEDKIDESSNWLIGVLIGIIVFLIVILIIVLQKQKTNKWWMK